MPFGSFAEDNVVFPPGDVIRKSSPIVLRSSRASADIVVINSSIEWDLCGSARCPARQTEQPFPIQLERLSRMVRLQWSSMCTSPECHLENPASQYIRYSKPRPRRARTD